MTRKLSTIVVSGTCKLKILYSMFHISCVVPSSFLFLSLEKDIRYIVNTGRWLHELDNYLDSMDVLVTMTESSISDGTFLFHMSLAQDFCKLTRLKVLPS
jgi:hypothetical protein